MPPPRAPTSRPHPQDPASLLAHDGGAEARRQRVVADLVRQVDTALFHGDGKLNGKMRARSEQVVLQ